MDYIRQLWVADHELIHPRAPEQTFRDFLHSYSRDLNPGHQRTGTADPFL
jgi:hypothetical protein